MNERIKRRLHKRLLIDKKLETTKKSNSTIEKISIVVVTYHNDFLLLARLLNSIYQYWDPAQVDKISIILNDTPVYYEEFENLIARNTNSKFKITSHYAVNLAPKLDFFNWNSQQLLKCLSHELVDTEWYIIHDCKDFYIGPVEIADIFNDKNQAAIQLNHARGPNHGLVPRAPNCFWAPGPFSMALKISYDFWDLDYQDYRIMHFPTGTPFIVKTEIMREMVSELKTMTKGFFHLLFLAYIEGELMVTEFLLYGAYAYKKNKWANYINWDDDSTARKFFLAVCQSKDLRTEILPTV